MRLSIWVVVSLCALAAATSAQAQQRPAPERNAVYVELQGIDGFQLTDGFDDEHALGFQARVGMRPWPRFGFDIGYEREADVTGTLDDEFSTATAKVALKTQVYSLNLKWFLLTGRIQPYLSAGPAAAFLDYEDPRFGGPSFRVRNRAGFATRVGTGVDLFITDQLVGVVELGYTHGIAHQVDGFRQLTVGWGLQYRFYRK